MKKILILVSVLILCFGLIGTAFAEKIYNLKLGHCGAPNHHYQAAGLKFAEMVKERTDGHVVIDVFPSNQLGKQLEITEGCFLGTHDISLVSDTVLSNWIPDFGILNFPFLFKNNGEVRKVLDGEIGKKFEEMTLPFGAIVIGWWDNGMRHITNSKRPIYTPDDLKGIKIRVPEGEVFVETFKALGASPTVITFGELYSALQLGTVDGQENPPAHIITQKFYEVQDYVSRTGHIHLCSPLIMNKKLYESMPKEYQEAIMKSGMEMGPIHTQMVEKLEEQQWKDIAAFGMKINDISDADHKLFVEKVKPVYDMYKKKLNGELINEIQNFLSK